MKNVLKIFLIGAFVGGVVTTLLWNAGSRDEVERLKQRADSAEAAAIARDSAATEQAARDSAVIDSLQQSKRSRYVTISTDSATQDSLERAMGGLKTARDTIANQAGQIVALKSERDSLRANARTDSLSLWLAMRRGDALRDSLHAQTGTVVALNAEIQRLNHHTFPKWLRVSFTVVEKALAVKGAVDLVQGR